MKHIAAIWTLFGLLVGCRGDAPAIEPAPIVSSGIETSAPEPAPGADTVKATKSLTGRFVGFEAGDYLHGVFSGPEGERVSFFLERGTEIFLVDHAGELLDLEVQTVETEIPEAGGRIEIERVHDIRAGEVSFADWWKTAEPSFGKLLDEYQPRIEKATLAPEDVPAETSEP